jgi:hypothetical protein
MLPECAKFRYILHQNVVSAIAHPVVVENALQVSEGVVQFALVEITASVQSLRELLQVEDGLFVTLSLMTVIRAIGCNPIQVPECVFDGTAVFG